MYLEEIQLAEATVPHVTKRVDPALMTIGEYYKLVNPGDRCHSEDAYQISLENLNSGTYGKRDDYTLLRRITVKGVRFEVCQSIADRWKEGRFVKTDPDGIPIRINGELQYYSVAELEKSGVARWKYKFAIFDTDSNLMVGWLTDDEWGCLLVVVAPEYRGFGFGVMLVKLFRGLKPDYPSGGFTPSGSRNFHLVHQEFVREYLRTGTYSELIRAGVVTAERVREIIQSTFPGGVITRPKPKVGNLASNDPKDWLLYVNHGAFIIYDRKLADIYVEDDPHWVDRMIKGYVYVGGFSRDDWFHIKALGADSEKLNHFLMRLALSYADREGVSVVIENEQKAYLPDGIDSDSYGPDRAVVKPLPSATIAYDGMALAERRFRRQFDRYDEFHDRLIELAEGKFRL